MDLNRKKGKFLIIKSLPQNIFSTPFRNCLMYLPIYNGTQQTFQFQKLGMENNERRQDQNKTETQKGKHQMLHLCI